MPNFPRRPSLALASIVLAFSLGACGGGDDAASGPVAVAFQNPTVAFVDPINPIDLKSYIRTGRYSLPVGTGANLLAEEASAVTYNKDTGTLFVVGDGGTSITQVTKKGVLVDSMTLAADATKPQGTYFYDPEGLTYLGGGKFALVEERYRQINEFTYAANTTLGAAGVKTVKLGTTIGNIGIEGISFDPMTSGFIAVKESGPLGLFQTSVNFATGTATNASPTTENSTNLFDPVKAGLTALNDVFALSNILASSSADYSNLLILSAPNGKIVKMSRAGDLLGTLDVGSAAQNEGMTMDTDGVIYVVSEVGGGPGRPELLVFSPTASKDAVAIASNLYLTFNQTVVAGTGSLTLSNGAGDTRVIAVNDATQVKIRDRTLIIDPAADLVAGTTYSVTYPAGLFKDALGNNAPAATGASAASFTATGVVDNAAPTLVITAPVDEASGITSSRVILTFNEPVVAGSGNIVISNGMGDTRTIPVGDITQVSFSGNSANINPGADLIKGTTYNVQLASGVIKDVAGNPFAGITNATTLNFSMAAAAPTVLAAGDLLFVAGNADSPDAFAFVLLKPISAGTQIGFTDRDYSATTGMPVTGESAYLWAADVAYPAGTVISVQTNPNPPLFDKGSAQGAGGGISGSAETIYAFQGSINGLTATTAGALVVDRFIAALNIGTAAGDIPAEVVAAGAYLSFPLDNARYNGSMDRSNLADFAARVRDFGNWVTDDATAYTLTDGSLFPGY